ncbi:General amino acid permease [Drechslerella dactyloides]|uniref:General amino acid permease n=1 Tax=Drechslerella dactyloides TaxID=74499 RepID=A0AAD6IPF1_DREDA|nr:General amino acid permease [Drechslerella dactyloides]
MEEADNRSASTGSGVAVKNASDQTHRKLKERHVQLIGIGGTIGTALFVAIGRGLALGGPANLFLGFTLWCTVVLCVNNCLAEMVSYLPISSPFIRFAGRFVDPAFGVATGYNFFIFEAMMVPFEIIACTFILDFWGVSKFVHPGVFICIVIVLYAVINIFAVAWYGEAEFWMALGKVILIVGLLVFTFFAMLGVNPMHDRFGFRYWNNPGAFSDFYGTGSMGRFMGFLACFIQASFTIAGPDYVSMAAGETENPRKILPKAFNGVFFRLATFFVLGSLAVGVLVPYNSQELLDIYLLNKPASGAAGSPYVLAMQRLQIGVLPHVVNALILTSALSAGNSYVFCASRSLFGLALEGKAPKIFTRTNRFGVPIYCVGLVLLVSLLAFLQMSTGTATVFNWFIGLVTASQLMNYAVCSFTYIMFYRACMAQDVDRSKLPFCGKWQPYTAYYSLFFTFTMTFVGGFGVFLPGNWNLPTFFFSYTMPVLVPTIFIVWKLVKRTRWVRAEEADLVDGLEEIEAYEQAYVETPGKFERWQARCVGAVKRRVGWGKKKDADVVIVDEKAAISKAAENPRSNQSSGQWRLPWSFIIIISHHTTTTATTTTKTTYPSCYVFPGTIIEAPGTRQRAAGGKHLVMTDKERHHKACDECRIRKLKCPGEYPACSRCVRDGVPCVYSLQKTMGRPRKRRRSDALRAHHHHHPHHGSSGSGAGASFISIPVDINGHHADGQWMDGNMFLGDDTKLLDLNILEPGDTGYASSKPLEWERWGGGTNEWNAADRWKPGRHDHASGCIPHQENGASADLDSLFDPSVPHIDFSSLLSDVVMVPPDVPQAQPPSHPHSHSSPSSCSGPHFHTTPATTTSAATATACSSTSAHTPPPFLSNLIDHTKIPLDIGTAMTPKDLSSFNIQPDAALGLTCDCLIHFFSAIVTLKKMIYNPVHLSPPTPFATPPPPISLQEITAISSNAIDITRTSLKCASCNMCFTTLMNVGQLLGLLLRAYSQFLQTSGTGAGGMPREAARAVVNGEMEKILEILGQVEIRSLARHGMVLGDETRVTKDMVGRGVIERIATGSWVGDRNPLCLKIVGMVRGLADGLLCGVGVGECVNEQCASGLNTIS